MAGREGCVALPGGTRATAPLPTAGPDQWRPGGSPAGDGRASVGPCRARSRRGDAAPHTSRARSVAAEVRVQGDCVAAVPAATCRSGNAGDASRLVARPRKQRGKDVYATTLVDALKRILKGRGITYARVAAGLDLSEASVKRMFSRREFTLQRLEDVCRVAGVEFAELVHETTARIGHRPSERRAGAGNRLRSQAHAGGAVRGRQLDVGADRRHVLDVGGRVHRAASSRLDRRRIIELQPGNRIRPLISRTFSWRPDGPIQRYFRERVESEYLSCKFDRPDELFLFVSGMLSRRSTADVIARMRRVVGDFAELHAGDRSLPLARAPRHEPARRDPAVGAARVSRAAPRRIARRCRPAGCSIRGWARAAAAPRRSKSR